MTRGISHWMLIVEFTELSILESLRPHWALARTLQSSSARWLTIERFIRSFLPIAFGLGWRRLLQEVLFQPASCSSLAVELRYVVFRSTQPDRNDSCRSATCSKANQGA